MKLCIIEDDLDFAEILRECLKDRGIDADCFIDNEADAMEFARSGKAASYDSLLIDINLPMSATDDTISRSAGLNLAFELRHRQSYPGVMLIITNSRSVADGEKAIMAGCDGYICKHARMEAIPQLVDQIHSAITGDVMLVSKEMRHVFLRGEISPKEACLMSLVCTGSSWPEIAHRLGYKSSKAAANIADRVYDKLLGAQPECHMEYAQKRERAVEIWRKRNGDSALLP